MPLFRQEVLDARHTQHLGTIRLGRPLGFSLVTAIALMLGAALIGFAIWGEVTRKVRLTGLLVPTLGNLQLAAPLAGVLLELRVHEGDAVRAGQALAVLDTDRGTAQGSTAVLVAQTLTQRRNSLEAERTLRVTAAQQHEQSLHERLRSTQAQWRQAQQETELTQRRAQLALKTHERYLALAAQGFVADIQAQQKQEELIDLQTRAQSAARNALALQREAQDLHAEIEAAATQLKTDLAQLDRTLATLNQETAENEARRQIVITAPQPGIVTASTLHPGQAVQAGQTVLTLVPQASSGKSSELQAQLYAPSRTAGFIQPGQAVWLRYAAYPYQKFGMAEGEVAGVSRTPINPQDLPAGQAQALLTAAQSNEPMYRIDVTLKQQDIRTYGTRQTLKPGMALEADVAQDRRTVWEWVLEPVLAASAKARVLGTVPNGASPGR